MIATIPCKPGETIIKPALAELEPCGISYLVRLTRTAFSTRNSAGGAPGFTGVLLDHPRTSICCARGFPCQWGPTYQFSEAQVIMKSRNLGVLSPCVRDASCLVLAWREHPHRTAPAAVPAANSLSVCLECTPLPFAYSWSTGRGELVSDVFPHVFEVEVRIPTVYGGSSALDSTGAFRPDRLPSASNTNDPGMAVSPNERPSRPCQHGTTDNPAWIGT